jgi:hypothetical protein
VQYVEETIGYIMAACVAMSGQPDASLMLDGGRLLVVELGNEELLVVEVEEDTQLCSVRVIVVITLTVISEAVEAGSVMSSVVVV